MSNLIKKVKIMQEDGTFTDYIPLGAEAENINVDGESVETKLGKKPYYYDTVADMKADTKLKAGDLAVTLGYYSVNDGGKGEYQIISGNYTDNGGTYHQLNNNLFANLIINNEINIKQFGAYGDNNHNDSNAIQSTIDALSDGMSLYIPKGVYLVNDILITKRLLIHGNNTVNNNINNGSVLKLNVANKPILKLHGPSSSSYLTGVSIHNVSFAGNNLETDTLISVQHAQFININECSFNNVQGSAIAMAATYESGIYKSVFRLCGKGSHGVINLLDYLDSEASHNTNNIHIEYNTFGYNSGNWLKCDNNANTDILWFCNNKLEYDHSPSWTNSEATSVIYLGQIFRCFILNNSFTFFKASNNNYTKIIECNKGTGIVTIANSKISYADDTTTFITSFAPVIYSYENVAYDSRGLKDIDFSNCSSITHNIQPTIIHDSNGAVPNQSSNHVLPKNFVPAGKMPNANKYTVQYDINAINYMKLCTKMVPWNPCCIFNNIYSEWGEENIVIKIRARKISNSVNNSNIILVKRINNSDVQPGIDCTVNSTDWKWYQLTIPKAQFDADYFFLTNNASEADILLDGFILPF